MNRECLAAMHRRPSTSTDCGSRPRGDSIRMCDVIFMGIQPAAISSNRGSNWNALLMAK